MRENYSDSLMDATAGFMARSLEPATETFDEVLVDDVAGQLPEELQGTLYRSGPARWEAGGFSAQHLFDGDGLVSKFVLDGRSLRYQSRYVRTPKFLAEEAGKGAGVRGLATQRRGGPLANIGRLPADRANTTPLFHAERLLALTDDGRPWDIDPRTLATLGTYDFDGKLPAWSTFSPHPKHDPLTGEVFNFGLTINPLPRPGALAALRCYRIDRAGRLHTIRTVPLDRIFINHDFAITQRYLVFVVDPLHVANPVPVALGLTDASSSTRFDEHLGSRVILVPRDGSRPRTFTIPAIAKVHVNNAYEQGDDIVVDVVRYPEWEPVATMLADFRDYDQFTGGTLTRLRITKSDRVTIEDLAPELGEFPMHDWRRTAQPFRYSYLVNIDGTNPARIIKIDAETGVRSGHGFSQGDFPGEPIFVPRAANAAEDDGWLLVVVYLAAEHRTALHVLDARDLEVEPIAIARLPHHFMPGFHGTFTDELRPAPCAS